MIALPVREYGDEAARLYLAWLREHLGSEAGRCLLDGGPEGRAAYVALRVDMALLAKAVERQDRERAQAERAKQPPPVPIYERRRRRP